MSTTTTDDRATAMAANERLLQALANAVAETDAQRVALVADRDAAIAHLGANGYSTRRIATLAGMTFQNVALILARSRS